MPNSTEPGSSLQEKTPRFDTRKVIVVLFSVMLLISIGLYVTYFLLSSDYDPRLSKSYTSVARSSREEIINSAKNDCKKVDFSDDLEAVDFNEKLKEKMVTEMGNVDTIKLLFIYDNAPELGGCSLIWAVDRSGVGYVGYENIDDSFVLKSGNYPKESVDLIYKEIDSSELVK